MAEAFRMAAQALEKWRRKAPFPYLHLPENFLYRHAVELYLKAMIITVHRARRLPYGRHSWTGVPHVEDGAGWKPLHRVYNVAALYAYVKRVIRRSRKAQAALALQGWAEDLTRLDAWVKVIEGSDDSSALFRYPTTKNLRQDRLKSSWQPVNPAKALHDAILRRRVGPMSLSPRGPMKSYRFVRAPQRRLSIALRRAADTLCATHDRLRLGLDR